MYQNRLIYVFISLAFWLLPASVDSLFAQSKKGPPANQPPGWGEYWTGNDANRSPLSKARREFVEAIRRKEFSKALGVADKMIALSPDNPGAYAYRAVAKRYLQRFDSARADLDTALTMAKRERSPELIALVLAEFGHLAIYQGRPAEAQDYLRKALKEAPNEPGLYNNYAWLLATSPTASVRNGAEAIRLATKACELTRWSEAGDLDTLAAAYAESGDFAAAVKWQTKAIGLVKNDKQGLADLNRRLLLYKNHQPYRSEK